MRIDDVLRGVEVVRRGGPAASFTSAVKGLAYDSREVSKGSLFVAMRGETTDGNQYIDAAVMQRAIGIITDSAAAFDAARLAHPTLALVEVRHGRRALSQLARNLFNDPQEQLALSGVTGTNGKTTTAFLLDAMLNRAGRKTVLVGTIEYHVAGQILTSPHTTPESRDLLELLARGVEKGATEAVMEVSSHALEQGRVHGLAFEVAIFTNLTRDHLDYHATMDKYFAAKRRLFDGSLGEPPHVAVVNIDGAYGDKITAAAQGSGVEVFTYALDQGDFRAENLVMSSAGMRFTMRTPVGNAEIASKLTGRVNVYNLLAASAAAMARGLSLGEVEEGAAALDHVPGRFQSVHAGQPFAVVVDYAHTDDALQNLVAVAREFVSAEGGRVITVFGCGGDRDRTKRPLMGKAAGEGSDFVVATSDNPRSEPPQSILAEIESGLKMTAVQFVTVVDRRQAIGAALDHARPGDIVLIAGKGHEKTQTIAGEVLPFDDAAVARELLAEMGFAACD